MVKEKKVFLLFTYFLTHLEFIRSYTLVVPSKTMILDQNGQSLYPSSDQNGAKTIPFGAAHTYMAYIRDYHPSSPPPSPSNPRSLHDHSRGLIVIVCLKISVSMFVRGNALLFMLIL